MTKLRGDDIGFEIIEKALKMIADGRGNEVMDHANFTFPHASRYGCPSGKKPEELIKHLMQRDNNVLMGIGFEKNRDFSAEKQNQFCKKLQDFHSGLQKAIPDLDRTNPKELYKASQTPEQAFLANFHAKHRQLYQRDKAGMLGIFRKSNINPTSSLVDIIDNAKKENNRTRKILVAMGVMDVNGKFIDQPIFINGIVGLGQHGLQRLYEEQKNGKAPAPPVVAGAGKAAGASPAGNTAGDMHPPGGKITSGFSSVGPVSALAPLPDTPKASISLKRELGEGNVVLKIEKNPDDGFTFYGKTEDGQPRTLTIYADGDINAHRGNGRQTSADGYKELGHVQKQMLGQYQDLIYKFEQAQAANAESTNGYRR